MSASVCSIFLMGYEVPVLRLRDEVREPGCEHGTRSKFCSECGAPRWKYKEVQIMYDSDDVGEKFTCRMRGYGEDEYAYIGLEFDTNLITETEFFKLALELASTRSEIEAELGKRKIRFDDCPFGFHLVAEIC